MAKKIRIFNVFNWLNKFNFSSQFILCLYLKKVILFYSELSKQRKGTRTTIVSTVLLNVLNATENIRRQMFGRSTQIKWTRRRERRRRRTRKISKRMCKQSRQTNERCVGWSCLCADTLNTCIDVKLSAYRKHKCGFLISNLFHFVVACFFLSFFIYFEFISNVVVTYCASSIYFFSSFVLFCVLSFMGKRSNWFNWTNRRCVDDIWQHHH